MLLIPEVRAIQADIYYSKSEIVPCAYIARFDIFVRRQWLSLFFDAHFCWKFVAQD